MVSGQWSGATTQDLVASSPYRSDWKLRLAKRWRQARCTNRSSSDHIRSGCCSHLDSRDGSPPENSSCSRPGRDSSHYSHSSHPDKHKSPGNRNASDPGGLPHRCGSLPGSRGSRPAEASLRHTHSSRSRCRHDSNDSSEPSSSTDHARNRAHGRSEKVLAADVHVVNSLPESGTATCDCAAVIPQFAVAPDPVPDPRAEAKTTRRELTTTNGRPQNC
jgi:hypothetical protein